MKTEISYKEHYLKVINKVKRENGWIVVVSIKPEIFEDAPHCLGGDSASENEAIKDALNVAKRLIDINTA